MFRAAGRLILIAVAAALPAGAAAGQSPALERSVSRFALHEGARIHYKNLGAGPIAVVFIHGWLSDLTLWRYQAPALDGRVRAVYIDLPGHGRSEKPRVSYTMDYFAAALNTVLTTAGVERVVLVGHSMGAQVVRQFYRRYPAKTIALVAVDGALRSPFTDTVEARALVGRYEGADYAQAVRTSVERMFPPGADSALKASVLQTMSSAPQHVAVSSMRAMTDPAIWAEDPIEVPLLALMADNPFWTADYEAFLRRLAPRLRYETIAGVGHFLMLERPEAVNASLTRFLSAQRLLR